MRWELNAFFVHQKLAHPSRRNQVTESKKSIQTIFVRSHTSQIYGSLSISVSRSLTRHSNPPYRHQPPRDIIKITFPFQFILSSPSPLASPFRKKSPAQDSIHVLFSSRDPLIIPATLPPLVAISGVARDFHLWVPQPPLVALQRRRKSPGHPQMVIYSSLMVNVNVKNLPKPNFPTRRQRGMDPHSTLFLVFGASHVFPCCEWRQSRGKKGTLKTQRNLLGPPPRDRVWPRTTIVRSDFG